LLQQIFCGNLLKVFRPINPKHQIKPRKILPHSLCIIKHTNLVIGQPAQIAVLLPRFITDNSYTPIRRKKTTAHRIRVFTHQHTILAQANTEIQH